MNNHIKGRTGIVVATGLTAGGSRDAFQSGGGALSDPPWGLGNHAEGIVVTTGIAVGHESRQHGGLINMKNHAEGIVVITVIAAGDWGCGSCTIGGNHVEGVVVTTGLVAGAGLEGAGEREVKTG